MELLPHRAVPPAGQRDPVVKACARFFHTNVVYEAPDGGMFLGQCNGLERQGLVKINP